MKLNSSILENSPVFIADLIITNKIIQQIISKRNKFGVAFSTAKTAINIALETESDSYVTKIWKASCKKRVKSSIEVMGRKKVMLETLNHVNVQETNDSEGTLKSQ
ncbi:hypothetical protein GLOIN_2v1785012 [Rhizophagus irregularis DAOM 181602=DAOM 197198]|uniref:Uncharacterized protein n=1 Tax=Rhizophagus irregularis (strain DAOM 181602 / DAOM 197198 / MUCL 43194) TaxID=747089 RepID=A0A2P4PBC1_RHIID|nr:hypothetical protein GLOIN_2v1785012 [Rhizophagus irregularis DAOM 181602=DAOM 197198]POG62689.1 hypothetical protein GLOIN_2v1785012 [Rhizophagus irregularis DAOM 181602=DAOM 197198]GET65080.1 hypothetical protein GLOIN_2v1785012 [Rhizophagus irregularis DAOM 181602=DAOM 197198]|eukprot:XP_025169555.1 hypothetical protein GLOIN_2v1785012 [Rhizophagus irregularis DAOM 181602=DAOM 197198]